MKISIDTLELKGADLPDGVNQAQFVDAIQESANSGGNWLDSVWNAARDVWQDHGYFETVVQVQTLANSVNGDVRHVSLRIHIDPGPQYRIADVRIRNVNPKGKLAFSNETLRDLIPLRPGELVDVEKAKQGLGAIQKLYASHGYIDMTATPDFQMDNQNDQISLFVMLDQGDQYRVGKVVALGFGPTGQKALGSKIKPGDIFDWSAVRDFYSQYSWLMPPGASVRDDHVQRDAKTGTVNLLLDFRSCPEQTTPHAASVSPGSSH